MRALAILYLFLFIFSTTSKAQCDAPETVFWHFTSDTDVEIEFLSSDNAVNYEIDFIALYNDFGNGNINPDTLSFEGSLTSGFNSLQFNLTSLSGFDDPETYYYEALLHVECGTGELSAGNRFYVSPHSLLNDLGFQMSDLHFNPITFLPDANSMGISYETSIIVPPDSIAEEVDSISVLIDIGHTYLGDLSVSITSPQGITVQLRDFPTGGGGNNGYSVLYRDGATPSSEEVYPLRGIYAPAEPLSAFTGTPKSGVWTVTVTDNLAIDYGYLFGVGLYVNSIPCHASVEGTVFYDFDSDGMQGADEPSFGPAALFNSLDEQLFFSQQNGDYIDCSSLGQGELALLNSPQYYDAVPVAYDLDLSEGDNLQNLDYALQANQSVIDIEVDIFAMSPDRPGFENTYFVQYQNIGTECAYDVTVSVELDSFLEVLAVSDPNVQIIGNGVELLINELCPTESGMFSFHVLADSTLMIGDTLFSTVSTSVIAGEIGIMNNTETLESIVVGSYDPNDKQVDHTEVEVEFLQDGKLEYMIRFQNTGNYYAERVVITDLLPEELDLSTLSVMASSHDYELSNSGSLIYFTYEDIFLPDSASDFEGSIGFVRFEISPMDDLVVGDIITNGAKIYFDFNPAIITNDVTTEVIGAVGLTELPVLELGLYPNPVSDQLLITWRDGAEVERWEVLDTQSRVVLSGRFTDERGTLDINVADLSSGHYIFRAIGNEITGVSGFVKR